MTTDLANPDESAEVTLVAYRDRRGEGAKVESSPAQEEVVKSSLSSFHIPSLDGMRGAAFLLVFFGHALPAAYLRFVPPAFGVTVFFVLSGYLITTLLRKEFDRSGTVSLREFYLRRALRILPPFYIVLVLSSLLTMGHAVEGQVTLPSISAYVLHAANYWHIYRGLDEIPGGTSVYWSLSVEEHFYLLFPLLYWGMRRWRLSSRQQLGVILGLCGAVLAWRGVLSGVLHADHERLYRASDTRVDSILFGCALAVYGNPVFDRSRFSDKAWRWIGLPIGAVVLAATSLIRQPLFQDAVKGSLQAAALIPFFVVAIRCPKWGPMRLLNTRLMMFIGLLSYGLYLTHRTILSLIDNWVTSSLALQVPLALGLAVAFCYGLHVYVEAPCAELRKRLGAAKRSAQPPKRMPTPMQPNVAMG
ncbi:MAG TPA: acyltransferase [Polyangiaceae bacterium]|jgi:peptidoglycan/LPS O-acetylase OafA/YrhL|nr:acyltransferase [Polyangiaceae bacterium]